MKEATYKYKGFVITRTIGTRDGKEAYFYDAIHKNYLNRAVYPYRLHDTAISAQLHLSITNADTLSEMKHNINLFVGYDDHRSELGADFTGEPGRARLI